MIVNGVDSITEIEVSDRGTAPIYTATPNITTMTEGATVTYTILAIYFPSATLYWTNSGTTTSSDFTDGAMSGTFDLDDFGNATLTRTIVEDYTTEGSETIVIQLRTGSISGPVVGTATTVTVIDSSTTPVGQIVYTTPGTYSWPVPLGVLSICAVVVGGGGTGAKGRAGEEQAGGGGGGLRYLNNFTVTPGETLTVLVGSGGASVTAVQTPGNTGGTSYLARGANILVQAFGGSGASYVAGANNGGSGGSGSTIGAGFYGGTVGGGNGGSGGNSSSNNDAGGGGAGGYSGNGGSGQTDGGTFGVANQGTGGGAAGGATGGTIGGGGGGVGLLGQGTSGTSASAAGSGGTAGNPAETGGGGAYGGGAGGSDGNPNDTGAGGSGAVRILWGPGRFYPSTNTIDL